MTSFSFPIEPLETRIAPATLLSVSQLAESNLFDFFRVAADGSGNTIVVGRFVDHIDTDPGVAITNLTTTDPNGDLFIMKLKPDGSRDWATRWGGLGLEQPRGIVTDASGDILVVGEFASTGAGFGGSGTLTTTGSKDVFVLKLKGTDGSAATNFSTDGQFKWGGTQDERGMSLALDGSGRLLVFGDTASTDAGFDGPGSFAANDSSDTFLLRVDAATAAPDTALAGGGVLNVGFNGNSDFADTIATNASDDILLLATRDVGTPPTLATITKRSGTDGSVVTGFGSGGTITLPVTTVALAMTVDHSGRVVFADAGIPTTPDPMTIRVFDGSTGAFSPNFNSGSPLTLPISADDIDLVVDSHDHLLLGGQGRAFDGPKFNLYLARVSKTGVPDATFGPNGIRYFAPSSTLSGTLHIAIDPSDVLHLRGENVGAVDIDPTNTVFTLKPRADVLKSGAMNEGFVATIDPYGIDAKNPLTFQSLDADTIRVAMTGAGSAHYSFTSGALEGELDTIELIDTDLTTTLTIAPVGVPTADNSIHKIITRGANQDVGNITLGLFQHFGDGSADNIPDLHVTGRMKKIDIANLEPEVFVKLGDGLPYNVEGEDRTSDTYNNHPDFLIGAVLGPGLRLEVTGNGMPSGTGGGGLGKVFFGFWQDPGVIRTTQSIGDFTVQFPAGAPGTFLGVLEVDKFHVGAMTEANVGNMTIENGSWGSSGSEIEGSIKSFNADAFLAGATLTAASVGKVGIDAGAFEGTLTLTDPDAPALPTFVVDTNFTGLVKSASPIKKLKIKGDFTGSLEAPFIGSITAFSFLGGVGSHISANSGGLGTLTATAGVVRDYTIMTPQAFKGFNIKLSKLTSDTVGIDNVNIQAASIGNITVSLTADPNSKPELIGIRSSSFTTTGNGSMKATAGSIGNISVTLTGASGGGSATGIQDSSFDAMVELNEFGTNQPSTLNSVGRVAVKISGAGGASLGVNRVTFSGDTIGTTSLKVFRGANVAATARALDTAEWISSGQVGSFTIEGDASDDQVNAMKVRAGGKVGDVKVKAKDGIHGSIVNSAILAGQGIDLSAASDAALLTELVKGSLGAVNLSGSLSNSTIASASRIGPISIGVDASESLIFAGAKFGGDYLIDGNETYQRAASIAAITIKGSISKTSIAAGVDPGTGTFGDGDDVAASALGSLAASGQIGTVVIGSGAFTSNALSDHHFAIEATGITSVKLGATPALTVYDTVVDGSPADPGNAADEDSEDIVIRLIPLI